jgi:hypothetical protein
MRRAVTTLLALGFLTAASTGCAARYKLDAKAPTHAALAKLKVKVNRDELRELKVTVDHLAPPHRLGPQYKAYAVWIQVPGHGTTKLGLLDYNENRRRGTIDATTPFSKFEVIITLETNPSTAAPSNEVIVSKIVGKG